MVPFTPIQVLAHSNSTPPVLISRHLTKILPFCVKKASALFIEKIFLLCTIVLWYPCFDVEGYFKTILIGIHLCWCKYCLYSPTVLQVVLQKQLVFLKTHNM